MKLKCRKNIPYDSEVEDFGASSTQIQKLYYGKLESDENRCDYLRQLYPELPISTDQIHNSISYLKTNPFEKDNKALEFEGLQSTYLLTKSTSGEAYQFPNIELKFGQTVDDTITFLTENVFFESTKSIQQPKVDPVCVIIEDHETPEESQIDYDVYNQTFSSIAYRTKDNYRKLESIIDRKSRLNNRVLGKHSQVTDSFGETLDRELDQLKTDKIVYEKGTKTFLFEAIIHSDCNPRLSKDGDFNDYVFTTKYDLNKYTKENQWKSVIHSLTE